MMSRCERMGEQMKDLDCNIIKDLMPLYLDAICSEESRNLVDTHLNNCEQCRTQLERLKNGKLRQAGRNKKISYFKKIKKYDVKKEILSILLLVIVIIGGCLGIQDAQMASGMNLLYLFFPIILFVAYGLVSWNIVPANVSKLSWIFIGVSIALFGVYFAIIIFWSIPMGRGEDYIFNIPLEETGFYLDRWLKMIAAAQLGIFVLSNFLRLCGCRIHKIIYGLTLTGVALSAGYLFLLGNLSTFTGLYKMLTEMVVCVVLEGILFSVLSCYFINYQKLSFTSHKRR